MTRGAHAILASTFVVFGLGGCLAAPDGPAATPGPDAGTDEATPGDQSSPDASPTGEAEPDQSRCQPGSQIDLVYVSTYVYQDEGITAYSLEGVAIVVNTSTSPVTIDNSEVLETRHDGMLRDMAVSVTGQPVVIPPGYGSGNVDGQASSLVADLISEPVEIGDPSMTIAYTTHWVSDRSSDSDGDAVLDIGGYIFDLDFKFESESSGTKPVAARRVTGTCMQ